MTAVAALTVLSATTITPAEAKRCKRTECSAAKSHRSHVHRPAQPPDDCRGRNDNVCASRDPFGTKRDLAGRPINPDGSFR